jgi:tetratricopeptide (TPR) repeat protein
MNRKYILVFLLSIFSVLYCYGQDKPDALKSYRQGDYERAVEVCLMELEALPKNVDSYVVLGWSLLKLDRYQDAVDYTEKALKISRYDPRLIQIIAEGLFELGRNLESLKYFQEYATIAPTSSLIDDIYYFMGEIFIRFGEFNHADIALSTAVYHSPNVAGWWNRLGYAREKAGGLDSAIKAYNKALTLNPNTGEAARGIERVKELQNSQ